MTITYVNHATVLIQLEGVNIITDPVYSLTLGFIIPRLRKAGIPFDQLPAIDFILISHNHHDHLNLRTLRRLNRRRESTTIVLPIGLAHYAQRAGFSNIVELEDWKTIDQPHLKITSVPAKHYGRRNLWESNESQYCGYVVESRGESIYFAGDTGYGEHFKEIGSRFVIDVALLPIGAYKPYEWFKNIHLNPMTAVQAFIDLGAKQLVPIHWGTFKISDEPLREPPLLLQQEAERLEIHHRIHILENGESFSLTG